MLPAVTKNTKIIPLTDTSVLFFTATSAGWHGKVNITRFRCGTHRSKMRGEKARVLMWKVEHDAAYERANTEAVLNFNRCPQCGQRVCDDCFAEFEIVCLKCEVQIQNKRRHSGP